MSSTDNSRARCECGSPQWKYGGPADEAHPRCERPYRLVCLGCDAVRLQRCARSSRVACAPCSATYRGRVRRIFESGYSDNPLCRLYFVTLTAPGDRPHFIGGRKSGRVCPCTAPEGVNLAEWNATAGARFNRVIQYLRRELGDVQYAKAAEVQKRGALHFHVLVRPPLGRTIGRALWAPAGSRMALLRGATRHRTRPGPAVRWGR